MNQSCVIKALTDVDTTRALAILREAFASDPTVKAILLHARANYEHRVETYFSIVHDFFVATNGLMFGAYKDSQLVGVIYAYFDTHSHKEAEAHIIDDIKAAFEQDVAASIFSYENTVDKVRPKQACQLGLLAVHPDFQGQGVGSSLMQHFLVHVRQHYSPITVVLDTANARNIILYQRLGFHIIDTVNVNDVFIQTVMFCEISA